MDYQELSGEQRRQLIDTQQIYGAWRPAAEELAAMPRLRWQSVKGKRYLYEMKGRVRKSLGAESAALQAHKRERDSRREALEERVGSLKARLAQMAPVNQAMGLGRLPKLAARIVRELDREGLLGSHIIIAGTNALYAYEGATGVVIGSDHVATGDADLVWDTGRALQLASTGIRKEGLIGLLRRVDSSFVADYGFNATNRDGYIVDLLCAEQAGNPVMRREGDLGAVPMAGINWLIGGPKLEQVVIGEDGEPVRLVVPEPRLFALHKLWVSKQASRSGLKRNRDAAQARIVAELARKYLGQSLDAGELADWPRELLEQSADLSGSEGKA